MDVLALSATEGIAYVLGQRFAKNLLPASEWSVANIEMNGDHALAFRELAGQLIVDGANDSYDGIGYDDLYRKWIVGDDRSLAPGETVGIMAVQELVRSGHDFATIVTMSPEQIISAAL
jgi:hypothetical protein